MRFEVLFLSFVSLAFGTQTLFFEELQKQLIDLNPGLNSSNFVCGFRDTDVCFFCDSLDQLTYLALNALVLESIPPSICAVQTLKSITIYETGLNLLPSDFGSLTNLTYLDLSDNLLTALPESMASLTQLKELYLHANRFSSFPLVLTNFSNLTYLVLQSNSMTTIPKEFSSLTLLKGLDLNDNPLLRASTELFNEMKQLGRIDVDNTLISGFLLPEGVFYSCSSTCISEKSCTKNPSCPCSSFFADFCPYYCGVSAQQICVDCSSLVSKQQCTGDCSWCSGKKDGFDCHWCDLSHRCTDFNRCNVCSGFTTSDKCESSDCYWCEYEYCVGKEAECEKICSNLAEAKCDSDLDCLWCSSYSICLETTSQCLSCDRFTSSFCPPGCNCPSGSNSSVLIVVCIVCSSVFFVICVCFFVLFVLKKRFISKSNHMNLYSNSNTLLRFDNCIELTEETSRNPIVSRYSECCFDSLFKVSPSILSFSSSGSPLKLCSPVTFSFEMMNVSGMELDVDCLFVKGFKEKHEFLFSPSSFKIGKNEKRKISVELKMNCSATLSPSQSSICCGVSTKQQWCSLCGIQVLSELSPLLSCDDIELKRELGRGAFGKVFLGSFKGNDVAIKISNGMSADDFNAEANTLSKLHSPYIVTFYGISHTMNAMIIEFCKYGSVEDYYSKHSLKVDLKRLICFDISRGMKYLHLNGIIHRDLKPANILLSSLTTDLNVSRSKISDFGTSRSSKMTMKMTRGVGTPSFMAPEIFDTQEYGRSSDVYAFGMTIWSLFTQKTPFEEESMSSIIVLLSEGKRPPLPSSTICVFNDLIERCWAQNPHQRPSFDEISENIEQLLC